MDSFLREGEKCQAELIFRAVPQPNINITPPPSGRYLVLYGMYVVALSLVSSHAVSTNASSRRRTKETLNGIGIHTACVLNVPHGRIVCLHVFTCIRQARG